jgi:hypothetical protein
VNGQLTVLREDLHRPRSVTRVPRRMKVRPHDDDVARADASSVTSPVNGSIRRSSAEPDGEVHCVRVDQFDMFPKIFSDQFEKIGIRIGEAAYGAWWEVKDHLANAYEYDQLWLTWLDTAAEKNVPAAYEYARQLARRYGLNWPR